MEDKIRAFIAIEIPDKAKRELFRVASIMESQEIRIIPKEQLHITLFFFAQLEKSKVAEIIHIIESAELRNFEVTVNGFEVFDKRHPGVVFAKMDDKGAMAEIFESMKTQILDVGVGIEEREFTPHITVARTKHFDRSALDIIDKFISGTPISCPFSPVSLSLKQSVLGPSGPVHNSLYTKMFEKE